MPVIIKKTLLFKPLFPNRMKTTVANKNIPNIIAQEFDNRERKSVSFFGREKPKNMRLINIVRPMNKKAIDRSLLAV